jgi:hypothetical protein
MLYIILPFVIGSGCIVQSAVLYYLFKYRGKPTGQGPETEAQRNKVRGSIGNLAARDVVIKAREKPCERERFYFAQCKDMQNTINLLVEQIQHKDKAAYVLLARLELAESRVQELETQARQLPVLPIGTWKQEQPV